ncbi:MAG: hypothetical protein M3443_19795 [Actinomycetota bacterium]|nr:hypothetical protein [Actinomycetota bacterium]
MNNLTPTVQKCALAALWLALCAQAMWMILNGLILHRSPVLDVLGVIILVTLLAFAALHRHPRWRWLAVLVQALMAADFLLAVADRFGAFGSPGTPGVSWGNFAQFIDYTRSISPFLPDGLAPTLAVLATIAEVVLAVALLLGVRLQLAAVGAALLLVAYGMSMAVSLPAAEHFGYSVFLLAAAMLSLASLSRSTLSIDAVLARRAVSDRDVGLDRQPVVHHRVAVGEFFQAERQVQDRAGIELAIDDRVEQRR